MLRLFAAIEIPDDVAACLTALQAGLGTARWTPRENFHVTLRFLGRVDEAMAGEIDSALALLKAKPFTLHIESLLAFGDKHDARSVYAKIAKSEPLELLATKVDGVARGLGLTLDKRKFTPHITLGRLRGTPNAAVARWIEEQGQMEWPSFQVTHFTLYSSLRRAEGAIYTPERRYIL